MNFFEFKGIKIAGMATAVPTVTRKCRIMIPVCRRRSRKILRSNRHLRKV